MEVLLFMVSILAVCVSGVLVVGWLDVVWPKYKANRRVKKTIKQIMKGQVIMPREYDEDEYYECTECNEGIEPDHVHRIAGSSDPYCGECFDNLESAMVHSYGYRPEPNFLYDDGHRSMYAPAHPTDPSRTALAMGIEQEVEYVGSNGLKDGAEHVLKTINKYGEVVYLKEDGSISWGFEIVSHPGTLEYFMNHFNWSGIEDLSRMDYESWNKRSCGLHVHMSRSAFKDEKHLFKFLVFIYKNPVELIQFAGRKSSYAKFDIDTFLNGTDSWGEPTRMRGSSFMKMAKREDSNDDRYCAVNLRNYSTVELRFFRPSLRSNTTKAVLQFCDAAFNYTEMIKTPDVMTKNAIGFTEFRNWVSEQKDKYAILNARIAERVKERELI